MSVCIIFSCSDDDSKNDKIAPTIEVLPLNDGLTQLSLNDGDTLRVYRNALIDSNFVRLRFRDNEIDGLSSYSIRIRGLDPATNDTTIEKTLKYKGAGDTDTVTYAYFDGVYQSGNIFGTNDKIVVQALRVDSAKTVRVPGSTNTSTPYYPVWMKGPYQLRIAVTDRYGNFSDMFFKVYIAMENSK